MDKKFFLKLFVGVSFFVTSLCAMTRKEVHRELSAIDDDNIANKLTALIGRLEYRLHEEPADMKKAISASFQVQKGKWMLAVAEAILSTRDVYVGVAITIQHDESKVVALYHYFRTVDFDFDVLRQFIAAVKKKAQELNIAVANLKVSLISSRISVDFLICKRILMSEGFATHLLHAEPRDWESGSCFVESGDDQPKPVCASRLVFVSPSALDIHEDDEDDKLDLFG